MGPASTGATAVLQVAADAHAQCEAPNSFALPRCRWAGGSGMRAQGPFAVALAVGPGGCVLMRNRLSRSVVDRERGPENACTGRLPRTTCERHLVVT